MTTQLSQKQKEARARGAECRAGIIAALRNLNQLVNRKGVAAASEVVKLKINDQSLDQYLSAMSKAEPPLIHREGTQTKYLYGPPGWKSKLPAVVPSEEKLSYYKQRKLKQAIVNNAGAASEIRVDLDQENGRIIVSVGSLVINLGALRR